ncbi:MAG: hypothetical protein ACKOGJ_03810, partial [Phycisphaerales bacterium]
MAAALAVPAIITACRAPEKAAGPMAPAQSRGRPIRVGVIGCGGRGGGAAIDALRASPDTRIVALGDAFRERVDATPDGLAKAGEGRADVPASARFWGF